MHLLVKTTINRIASTGHTVCPTNYIFILSMCMLIANTQTTTAEPIELGDSKSVHFGGKLGLGFVTWDEENTDDDFLYTVNKLGFSIDVFAKIDLNDFISFETGPIALAVQPELSYAAKGAGIEIDGENAGEFRVSYLAIALLPRVEYPIDERIIPYAVIGPELGFLLEGEVENRLGTVTDIEDNLKSTDIGLILGAGADVPISAYGTLVAELRATLGLVSIDGQGDGDDFKNRAFSLLLGYQY